MPVDSVEWWQMVLGFFTTAITIAGAAWAAWISFKTKQWESMTRNAINESKKATEAMNVNSVELHRKMDDIRATTEQVKSTIDSISQTPPVEIEELSEFEKEFGLKK